MHDLLFYKKIDSMSHHFGPAVKIKGVYQNPIPTTNNPNGFLSILKDYITNKEEKVPKQQLGPFTTDISIYSTPPKNGLRVTWMGHSSLLIEIDGYRFLTDPVVGRASFVQWAGPKRFFPYPIAFNQLPPLDAILLSHDHYDHLDILAIKELASFPVTYICSEGVGKHLVKWGVAQEKIKELNWTESTTINNCKITATPNRHFSGRGIINQNQTLWSSFVISTEKHNIFFGADSGWWPGFHDIGKLYGPFDLTMLEVGAYGKGWPDIHMGPDNATNAHIALKGNVMMPIHWGTFNLALHDWREPAEHTIMYANEKNINLFMPTPGVPTDITSQHITYWWK